MDVAADPNLPAERVPAQRTGIEAAVATCCHFLPLLTLSTTLSPLTIARSRVELVPATDPARKRPPPRASARESRSMRLPDPSATRMTLESSIVAIPVSAR